MSKAKLPRWWSYCRRALGVGVCVALFALPVTSLCVDQPEFRVAPIMRSVTTGLGLGFVCFGLFVTLVNMHLLIVRPLLYRTRHGSYEGMRNISGFPVIGTYAAVMGTFFGIGHWPTAVLGLIVLTLDLGGLPWFVIATWHDSSFWDE